MGSTLASEGIALELLALLPVRSELVIELPFLGVLQDFIGFVDFLEFLLSRLVAGIEVGMVFFGQGTVCLPDLILGGILRHAEHLIGVSDHVLHILSAFV